MTDLSATDFYYSVFVSYSVGQSRKGIAFEHSEYGTNLRV